MVRVARLQLMLCQQPRWDEKQTSLTLTHPRCGCSEAKRVQNAANLTKSLLQYFAENQMFLVETLDKQPKCGHK